MSPETRRKVRNLTQTCPLCGQIIRPSAKSKAVAAACVREFDDEQARRLILVAHLRHDHTDYDSILVVENERQLAQGTPMEAALQDARYRARRRTAATMAALIRRCRRAPADQGLAASCGDRGSWPFGLVAKIVEAKQESEPTRRTR